ncbi:capsular exopolysaccharide biosynthesis protein [Opitutaceae bacterium TAV1]|nr:capsular exopolysaccharide biosynthesis protein [Opitutaceae bacterium TAV1]
MDSQAKQPKASDGRAEYGYGGYNEYPGYGNEASGQRTLSDYLLILRERIWYIVVVFLVIFSSALVYTFSQTKIFSSSATVQIMRRPAMTLPTPELLPTNVISTEDMNTMVKIFESPTIIQKVSERITGDELRRFMQPYEKGRFGDPLTPLEVLGENRSIVPFRMSLLVAIEYRHPDRLIAAKVANLFLEEFVQFNTRQRVDQTFGILEDLKLRAESQRKTVEDLNRQMQAYREKYNMGSLDKTKDIQTRKLMEQGSLVTQSGARLSEATVRWQQVDERLKNNGDLLELPFIASNPLVSQLASQIAMQTITIKQLRERYKEKHPKMIEASNALTQAQLELQKAVKIAAELVKSEYEAALNSNKEARAILAQIEKESFEIDKAAVDYQMIERDFLVNSSILDNTIKRIRELDITSTIEGQNIQISPISRAVPAREDQYVEPRIVLNLAGGFVLGIGFGLAFAFVVAFIDDRVKSSFDIESVVGLPLLGVIPQIKKMDQADKAQVALNNADRQVAEAFLTLHSSLRLRNDSKNAQTFLTTSTVPGEGKSFTTTNLALTFAAHGDRVVVLDCDLRKPNIHKSFRRENLKGVIDVCAGSATIDDVVMRDVHPNLDVIATGGRAKNPTQILNSKNFEIMIAELRKRYDRIFIDTPPLAAVSDALIILPLVSGSIFTIFFNKVRRKAAQHAARKLLESNVPVYGAVLNGLNLAVAGYYYAQYYDKSYKDYYVMTESEEGEDTAEADDKVPEMPTSRS